MKPNYIFVYGLLKSNYVNEPAQFIRKNCELVSSGNFPGSLFDLGTYPGAVYDEESESSVYGEVYQIIQNEEELVIFLDTFEGVGPDFEQPNEYKRELVPIKTEDGIIKASCYLYNWNLDGLKVIANGRYENEKGTRTNA